MNIYSKLTLLCLILVVGSTSILSFFADRKFEQTLKQEILRSTEFRTRESTKDIENFFYDRLSTLNTAASSSNIQLTIGNTEQLNNELRELELIHTLFFNFSMFDMDRRCIGDSKGRNIGIQEANSPFWSSIGLDNPMIMDISRSESLGRDVITFGVLVVEEVDNTPIGILVGRVLMDEFYNFLQTVSFGESGPELSMYLIDTRGSILFSSEDSETNSNSLFSALNVIREIKRDSTPYAVANDKLYFTGYPAQHINPDTLSLVVSIDQTSVSEPLRLIRSQILWIFFPVLIGSIAVALIAAHFFVRPLVKLSRAAEDLGKGKFNFDLNIQSKDEVGKLALQLTNTSRVLLKRIRQQRVMNQKLEEQKKQIIHQKTQFEKTNLQMTDSISYARRIQRSILPEPESIKRVLKDFMVFYQPKDIVSGDFYWFERVRKGRNDYLVIVCADCTGHGVPGAIMSIMGSNQLTNIVYYQNYLDPAKILARLDKAIKFELYAREGETFGKDGIEIGVCCINLDENTVEFSGAGMPLYAVRDNELEEFKSIKEMVGAIKGEEREVEVQLLKHKIPFKKGDRFYMATDGYQDQFGGPADRKFMVKNFRTLLLSFKDIPLKDQEILLNKKLLSWKGKIPQTDDILVMGFEFQ